MSELKDPLKCETLQEAALNADGTWNGMRALCWLSKVMHPPGIPLAECEQIANEVLNEHRAKRT